MKPIFSSIFCLLIMATSFAQIKSNSSEHLTFKGVPINGTLNEFVLKMKNSGFTLDRTATGLAWLQGDFAGYKDCNVGVETLEQNDLVSNITVIFPQSSTWSSLSYNYYRLKKMLTKKYGEPSDFVEKFVASVEPKDDNSKMHEVCMNNCKYYTIFELENGTIQLSIKKYGFFTGSVYLLYYDKINSEIIREKAMEDL